MFDARRSIAVPTLLLASATLLLSTDAYSTSHSPVDARQVQSQEGTITGQVASAGTGEPLVGAQVTIPGTGIGELTNDAGRYRITGVPAGEAVVRVQLIGYQTVERTVSVAAGETVAADFDLAQQAVGLEEIVVTGLASQTSRARAEVAVSSIDAANLADKVSSTTVASMIAGKAAGVRVEQASGAVGSGVRFKLRGGGGLKGTGQPIIYVDGVRVDNAEVEGPSTGGQGFALLSTLDPENIDNIDILKGPAAAALYGTSGSNGVVLITTKSGDGLPGQRTTFRVKSTVGVNEQHTPYSAHEYLTYEGANNEFVTGQIRDNRVTLSGGPDELRYYTAVGRRYEEGILRNISMDRYSLQGNFEAVPTEDLLIDVNTNYAIATQSAQDLDNAFGPLNNTIFITDQQLFSKTGSRAAVYAQSNLLDTNRFTGSLNLTWTPVDDFELQARMGYDGSYLREDETEPVGFSYGGDTDGNREIFQRENTQQNYNFNARYSYGVVPALRATTIAGVQLYNRRQRTTSIEKDVFPAEPLMNIGAGQAFLGADETALHERQAGIFASQQLSYDNSVFVTLAGRRDYSSVVGIEAPAIIYPKVSTAVRLDELGVQPGPISFLKLRAAYGQSGQLPELLDGAGRLWGGDAFGYGTGAVLDVIGNPEIKPERVAEIEAGFDAELFDAYTLGFTVYSSDASESIVSYRQSPSTGLTVDDLPFNVGNIAGWGLEADLEARLFRTPDMQLTAHVLWSYSENEVRDIGDAQPLFDWSNVIRPGLPRAGWYPYQNNGALFDEDGTYAGSDISFTDRTFVGTPYPKHEGSFSIDFQFLDDFSLYALSEWALDFYVFNATGLIAERYGNYAKRLRLAARLGDDRFRDVWEEEFPNIEQLEPGTPEYREVAHEYAMLDPQSSQGYIQPADYLNLSDVSLTYDLTGLVSGLAVGRYVSNASLTASVRNALLSSSYEGPDPRLHWQGARTIGRGLDFTSLQHPRTGTLTLNLTF